ncbi:T9SS sorting signal type C domain-containing protein [Flavobacterium sp. Fl-77]|uniref:T9SS sorting signal type C domain-containing protein n=1 Tax=Flavobacterium flavipigmentatum TaxID=2893884 RepID=A0AAJ2VV13_9FLAO|nr:T9SS sorting signal type C domain-containing protein [Flavobacterium sp. Fl-77]MDX6184407.1 T9SS sorting signal type C domain-containing protein [Flavobacterium sp. Fl-77]
MIKKLLFSTLLFFVFFSNYGQSASSYCLTTTNVTYAHFTGTNFPGFPNNDDDDAISGAVTLPFSFGFGGADYSQVKVSSNGWLTFGSSSVTGTQDYENVVANASTSKPILMPLWDDLRNVTRPHYEVTGTAPNRVFKVEWYQQRWNFQSNPDVISFQIWLYETTNVIEYRYTGGANAITSGSATIGIYDANDTYLTLNNGTNTATAQANVFTSNISAKPANGQVFRFTPPTPTAQAGGAITFCKDNTDTQTLSVAAGQYALVNVIKGFNYTFSVPNIFTASNENLTLLDTSNRNFSPPVNATGASGTSITWTANFSGQLRVALSSNCGGTGTGTMTLVQNSIGNTQDSQIASGAGSWIGHIYNAGGIAPEPFTNANYMGYYTAGLTESFSANFGGDAACIPVLSNGVQRASIYAEGFAVGYRMQSAKTPGCYVIRITGDDGVRLFVDPSGTTTPTNKVFDRWVEQGSTTYNYILVNLTASANLVFDYYENGGANVTEFDIQPFNAASNTITAPATVNFCSGGDPAVINGSLQYNEQDGNMEHPYVNFQWQVSTDNVTYTDITVNGTLRTYDPAAITNNTSSNIVRYYRRIATVNATNSPGFSCTFNVSNVVSITTYPVSVGGTLGLVTNGTPVVGSSTCHAATTSSTTFSLSGNVGSVIRWESSTDNFATAGTPIANTTTTLTVTNLSATTYYRAVVQSNGCTVAYSNVATIVVTGAPLATAATSPNCNGFTANWSSVVNATSYVLTIAEDNAFTIPVLGYNNLNVGNVTTYVATGLTALKTYYYRVVAVSGCGNSAASNVISIEVKALLSTTWNGSSWDHGAPNSEDVNIVFNGSYTSSTNLLGCSCQVNTGTVNIVGPNVLTLVNALNVSSGILTFNDQSSLMQTTNVQNTGNIVYQRNTMINRFDYTYYGSPVTGQTMVGFSPETLGDKFLTFDGANSKWFYENNANVMLPGKGYVIRGPQSFHDTNRVSFVARFTGIPNNGPVTGESVIAAKSYVVGNPYPSAIKITDFLAANPFLEGTVRFWTHNTNISPSGSLYVYTSTDYASCNATGGTAAQSGGVAPNGYIAAGQAIMVKVRAGESPSQIVFNNGMRKADTGNNSQFFKTGKNNTEAKVWLNFSNPSGVFKQALIGYVDGASNSYEDKYDGTTSNANTVADFYSLSDNKSLAIQGRAYPLASNDVVPLGYKSTIDGSFTIAIDHTEGDLDAQNVYLEDKVLNVVHDLKESAYTFTTAKGTFKERFALKYANKTLGTGDFEADQTGVVVSVKDQVIKVSSASENIKTVYVYDLSGKLLYEKTKVNDLSLSIERLPSSNQMLLVKVVLDNDFETTKKIVF